MLCLVENLDVTRPSFFFSRSKEKQTRKFISFSEVIRRVRIDFYQTQRSERKVNFQYSQALANSYCPAGLCCITVSLLEILSRWCRIVFHPSRKGENVRTTQQTNAHITQPFLKMCAKNFRIIFVGIDDSPSTIHWSQFPGKLKTFQTFIFLLSQHITRLSPSQAIALDAILFMTLL